jgi:hypothetical protein
MAAPALDFWFEFSSTYSYPAAMRIGALAAEAGVEVRLRPFLLGPIFQAHGWNTSPFILYPAKGRHMWRDLERICAALSLPFRRPEHLRNRGFWQHAWRWWGCRILQPRQLGRKISATPSIARNSPKGAASISWRRSAIFCRS